MNMPRPKVPEPLTRGELRVLRNLLSKAEVLVNHVPPPPRKPRGPERSKHAPPSTPELESFWASVHSRRQLADYTQEQLLELLDQRAIRARDRIIQAQREVLECGPLIEALQQPGRPQFTRVMDVRQAERELEGVKNSVRYQRGSIRQLRYARNKRVATKEASSAPADALESFRGTRVQGADYFDDLPESSK